MELIFYKIKWLKYCSKLNYNFEFKIDGKEKYYERFIKVYIIVSASF